MIFQDHRLGDYPFAIYDHSNAFVPHISNIDRSAAKFCPLPPYAESLNQYFCGTSGIHCFWISHGTLKLRTTVFEVLLPLLWFFDFSSVDLEL